MAVLLRANPGWARRICVAGARGSWLRQLQDDVPGVTTALGWRSLTTLVAWSRGGVRPPAGLGVGRGAFAHVPLRLGRLPVHSDRVLARAHDAGIRVIVWTVDEPATMHRLLDAGVDGIITDRPDLLRDVLISRGQWTGAISADIRSEVGQPRDGLPVTTTSDHTSRWSLEGNG